ncbi:unnamed protein product [Cercopithifilaria johnstoni]|uniref:Uncharacterized protein n=1 Tax=Cercopithifilaria johnstoni TaxID=2874296 RepID=A0A8J2MPF1_9BILA|nr:unnamed protein product [Cercopithifilaria johnstoni]
MEHLMFDSVQVMGDAVPNEFVFCEAATNPSSPADISDVLIDIRAQRVIVKTTLPADSVLEALEKTGKKCKRIC